VRRHVQRGRRLRPVPAREDRPALRPRDPRNRPGRRLPAPDRRVRLRPRTLRGRLTLVFALVTAVVCLPVAVLLHLQYRNALRHSLDDGLITRFQNLERDFATSGDRAVEPTLPDEEAFAQIVDVDGAVVNAAPRALLERQVLTKSELARARTHQITIERAAAPGNQQSRLLAGPAGPPAPRVVRAVGAAARPGPH